MNLNVLYQHIGTYSRELDCLYPVYLLYPRIPKYKIIQDEDYFLPLVKKYFKEIALSKKTIFIKGDLLIFKLYNGFHFGIYAGNEEFFHFCKRHNLRITRLSGYKKFLKGVYRWYHQ